MQRMSDDELKTNMIDKQVHEALLDDQKIMREKAEREREEATEDARKCAVKVEHHMTRAEKYETTLRKVHDWLRRGLSIDMVIAEIEAAIGKGEA